jgi:hypothetical protein
VNGAPLLLPWQGYYALLATASATLAGLLFVGLTFSVGEIKGDVEQVVRMWGEPPLYDFIQVLAIGCLAQLPDLTAPGLSGFLLGWTAWRLWRIWEVLRYLRSLGPEGELEFADWMERAVVPALLYGGLIAAALGLLLGAPAWPLLCLALDCLGTLSLGIYSTWTQLVWVAAQKAKGKKR